MLYCHLWHVWLYHILKHYLITIFGKMLLSIKDMFCFSLHLLSESFLIPGITVWYIRKCTYILIGSCQIWIKCEFLKDIFEKYSNVKFNENTSSGSRDVSCGRTDGQSDVTKLIVAFRSFANAPKNVTLVITDNVRNSHAPKTTWLVSGLIKSGSNNINQNYKNTKLKTE
jgi:hypothetical protein